MAAPYLKIQLHVVTRDHNGQEKTYTFTDSPAGLTALREEVVKIPTGVTATIWTASTDTIGDFERLILIADGDLDLEYTIDIDGTYSAEYNSIFLRANVPFIFTGTRGKANVTSDVFTDGTWDVIDKLRVKNQSSTNAVNLQMIMVDDT